MIDQLIGEVKPLSQNIPTMTHGNIFVVFSQDKSSQISSCVTGMILLEPNRDFFKVLGSNLGLRFEI